MSEFVKEQLESSEPLISVVVPVYNAAAFLKNTVGTIREQTLRDLEILLVDDGSRDDSADICRSLAQEDDRIRVFFKENGGASSARNVGIKNACGKYIGFVDADDLILPDMYERLYEGALRYEQKLASEKEVQAGGDGFIVQIGRREIDVNGKALPDVVFAPQEDTFVPAEEFARSLLLYYGDASFCTSLLPASYMKQHLFEEGVMGEDFLLLIKMSESIHGVLRLAATGYQVVHRAGSATRKEDPFHFSKAYTDIVRHADYVEQEMVPRHPDLMPAAKFFGLYERLDYMLHIPIAQMNAENAFYISVRSYLRRNFLQMLQSRQLTWKNKAYLVLLTWMPRTTRQIHWMIRRKKIMAEAGTVDR